MRGRVTPVDAEQIESASGNLPEEGEKMQMSSELPSDASKRADRKVALQLLRSWRNGNEQEQRETWEELKQRLDDDRLSNRKLFR